MRIRYYLEKILDFLRVRSAIGGLEISDTLLRFAYFDGKIWRLSGLRLEPGIMAKGKIQNYEGLVSSLKRLKSLIAGKKENGQKINTVVSLSSISVYSQVFSLPIIEGENLEKAIQLNIQMVSPIEASQAYSGWQTVGEDRRSLRLEILSAFIEKDTVDKISKALFDGGFLTVAVESRALALARLVRQQGAGIDVNLPYIVLNLDNSGLDLLIVRMGQLYFEYFTPWRDIAGDKGEISKSTFETTVIRNLHQVINFYSQHWTEPLKEVIVSAVALKEDIIKIIQSNFQLSVRDLKLKTDQPLGTEWFVALGSGLRGLMSRSEDAEVSLLGMGAKETFHRHQFLNFFNFWRVLFPVSMGLLFAAFLISNIFVARMRWSIESRPFFNFQIEETKEMRDIRARAKNFNELVSKITFVQKAAVSKSRVWDKVGDIATKSEITVYRFYFQSADSIAFSGLAKSNDKIIAFNDSMARDPQFANVSVPLESIKPEEDGLSFSMTLSLKK